MTTSPKTARPLTRPAAPPARLHDWLLDDLATPEGLESSTHVEKHHKNPWWKVMCLTGVDYFSTLGYQPAIAALAAGTLAPVATIVLIIVTLFGALPVYRHVAAESPHGEGSIHMLEHLLPRWSGKLFVLALLGFAATDFMITMTLSAADASAHVIENPFAPAWLENQQVLITLFLLALLAAVFLRGFREAVGVAVVLVALFLTLNVIVIAVALGHLADSPVLVTNWWQAMTTSHGSPVMMVAVAVLVFPRLALGMSGFETGVAVMPQIQGDPTDTGKHLGGRIRGARRLLTTAAVIMSTFLLTSSVATIILIPAAEFQPGGKADGRALAFLAHEYLGNGFGTVYDLSTIAILWFAGASAMAGMLNLVPRYLPRYGMAPAWAKASRPLVLVLAAIAFIITIIFRANVNAQGGAYATGVLVLMTSASIATTLSVRRKKKPALMVCFTVISLVFIYTTVANMVERPDGLRIGAIFILGIIVVSFASRFRRSFELRATKVHLDDQALEFVASTTSGPIRIISHEPKRLSAAAYRHKMSRQALASHLPSDGPVLFIEVTVTDSSEFESELEVHGVVRHGFRILAVSSPNVPNTIAAVLLHIRDVTGLMPHIYFRWTEGNPINNLIKYLFFGEGEIAPVTREVLREAEPDITRRPWVHVG